MLSRARGARGSALVGVVAAVSVVASAGLFGNGVASRQLELSQEGHWLMSALTAVHLNGGSKQVDTKTGAFDQALAGAQVVQGKGRAYAVKGGTVADFGPVELRASAPRKLVDTDEQPLAIEVPGADGPYLVYRSKGTVVRFGKGDVIPVGSPVSGAVVQDDQTLWAQTEDRLCALPADASAVACDVAVPAAHRGALTLVRGRAAFVDTTSQELLALEDGKVTKRTKLPGRIDEKAVIAPRAVGDYVVSLDRGAVTFTPLRSGEVSTYRLGPGTYSEPYAADDAVVVYDSVKRNVVSVDPMGVIRTAPMPGTGDVRLSPGQDGRVYADDAEGHTTVVVDQDGATTAVEIDLDKAVGAKPQPKPQPKPDKAKRPDRPKPVDKPVDPTSPAGSGQRGDGRKAVAAARVPDAPAPLTAAPGNAKATLTWVAARANGAALTGYTVSWTGTGDGASDGSQDVGPRITTLVVADLRNAATYVFSVTARNAVGDSPPAQSGPVTPSASVPDPPASVTATAGQDGTIAASWPAADGQGSGAITGYTATATSSDGSSTTSAPTSTTSATLTGLQLGLSYTVTVTSTNDKGVSSDPSAPSTAVTAWRPADAPGSLTATSSNNQASLTWSQPALNGGQLDHYELSVDGGSPTSVSGTSHTATGLQNGTSYTFAVRAVTTANGTSAQGAAATTTATPRGVPTASGAAASSNGDRSVGVSWSVNLNGGSSATCQVFFSGTEKWSGACGSSGSTSVGGLAYSTTYDVFVRASNDQGAGPDSNHVNVTTNAAPRTVTVSKGAGASVTGCTTAACARINVQVRNFAANTAFTVSCRDSGGEFYTYSTTTDAAGNKDSSVCVYGFPGNQVWAVVGGVESNRFTW